jgi:hypothetical protein
VTAVLSLSLVKIFGVHPYPLALATTIPEIARGNLSQFQWKATIAFFLQAAGMATPVFLLSVSNYKRRITRHEGVIGVLALVAAGASWRIGLLTDTMHGSVAIGAVDFVSFLQVIAAPYVCILLWRLLQQTLLAAKQGNLDTSEFLIVGLLAAHVASTLIIGSPFLRHYIPAFLFLTLLIIKQGLEWHRRGIAAVVLAALFISYSTVEVWVTRRMDVHAADLAARLTDAGVPENQIDGGFSWFSRHRISPEIGLPNFEEPKLARYQIRQKADFWQPAFFPFVVPWKTAGSATIPSHTLKKSSKLPGGTATTYLIDTQTQPKQ